MYPLIPTAVDCLQGYKNAFTSKLGALLVTSLEIVTLKAWPQILQQLNET